MNVQYHTKPADLMKVWSLPKSTEQRQFTIRVPSDIFYKLQALEEMFPDRSRNEMIGDLLATALDEFEESLPITWHESDEIISYDPDGEPIRVSWASGPRKKFQDHCESARLKAKKSGELKVVETAEEEAA